MSYLGASCGYWTLTELSRSHGRHATSRTRRQTRYWVRTTESEQSLPGQVCNRPLSLRDTHMLLRNNQESRWRPFDQESLM